MHNVRHPQWMRHRTRALVLATLSGCVLASPLWAEELMTPQTPWQTHGSGRLRTNVRWHQAMGYHFTPIVEGRITALGGYFNGTKHVKLFETSTGTLLASAIVTDDNIWSYTDISPVSVHVGQRYTVAVYLEGTGGSLRSALTTRFPMFAGPIRIEGSTHTSTRFHPEAKPRSTLRTKMYGQADILFVPSRTTNQSPLAQAGIDQTLLSGMRVYLDGRASIDPDHDPLTYIWRQLEGPPIKLPRPAAARVSFNAPIVQTNTSLRFQLTVSDWAASAHNEVTVTVQPDTTPPHIEVLDPHNGQAFMLSIPHPHSKTEGGAP